MSSNSSGDKEEIFMGTPPELVKAADDVRVDLFPKKSRYQYWNVYDTFIVWKNENKVTVVTENVVLAYFGKLTKVYKPTSLWSKYSMLKSTIKIKQNISIDNYTQLSAFLKQKSSGYEPKNSNILPSDETKKFLIEAPEERFLATKVSYNFVSLVSKLFIIKFI